MKIELKPTEKTNTLLRDMANKDVAIKSQAMAAFTQHVVEPIQQVINQSKVWGSVFKDRTFDKYNGLRMIPFEDLFDIRMGEYFQVWQSAGVGGGIPTQQGHGVGEMPFTTRILESAISFDNRQLRHASVDHVSIQLTRLAQEFLLKEERDAGSILFSALANATTDNYLGAGGSNPQTLRHVFRSFFASQFNLQDFNAMRTRHRRIFAGVFGGQPDTDQGSGMTDLFVSPEITEFLRNLAYEPMNTRPGPAGAQGTPVGSNTAVPGPSRFRDEMYSSGGMPSFFGTVLHETNDLGIGYRFNNVFDTIAGATDFGNNGDGTSATAFDGATEEIVIGVNRNLNGLLRMVAVDSDVNSTLTTYVDDQFVARSKRTGFWMEQESGYVLADHRALIGLII